MNDLLPKDYPAFLQGLKERICQAQTRAALAVSRELMGLYWQIGRDLEAAVRQGHWGEKVIERVAGDLKQAFPGVEGFSRRNLERMRAFYQAYPDEGQFAAQPVSQLPWGHNLVLLQKLKNPAERLRCRMNFYSRQRMSTPKKEAPIPHPLDATPQKYTGQDRTQRVRIYD